MTWKGFSSDVVMIHGRTIPSHLRIPAARFGPGRAMSLNEDRGCALTSSKLTGDGQTHRAGTNDLE